MDNVFTVLFLLAGSLLGGTEMVALLNKRKGDTASEKVWRLPTWARYLLGIFCLWLSMHFAFGWFTPTNPLPW